LPRDATNSLRRAAIIIAAQCSNYFGGSARGATGELEGKDARDVKLLLARAKSRLVWRPRISSGPK